MTRNPLLFALVVAACGGETATTEPTRLPAGVVELDSAQVRELGIVVDTIRLSEVAIPLSIPARVTTPDPLTAHLGSIVEGRVVSVSVLPGDRVRAGEAVVFIHSHELFAARSDLDAATAAVDADRAAVERSDRLYSVGAVALEEVQRRQVRLATSEAEVDRARDLVDHLNPHGDDVTIVAPTAGKVLAVHVNPGEAVLVGTPLVDVGDVASLWVTGWIPERSVPLVREGKTARIILAAFPGDTFSARVVRTGAALDPARRALDVRVAIQDPPDGLVPGMFATMLLDSGDRAIRAVLPAAAVQRVSSGTAVFLRDSEQRFRMRPVANAVTLPDGKVAVTGLEAGLEVVVDGAFRLSAALESRNSALGGTEGD